jgi:hypothetical protein
MSFSDHQIKQLNARLKPRHVKKRCANGKMLHYVEGWHSLSEANRIFGHENWDRETVSNQCVWQKTVDGQYCAAYLAKVRVTVRAGTQSIIREGQGSGEASCLSPGQAHEQAAKIAETDATKRAPATFGNPFGLSLYSGRIPRSRASVLVDGSQPASEKSSAGPSVEAEHIVERSDHARQCNNPDLPIDKSKLVLGEPKRRRCEEHFKNIRAQPCLICGRAPSHAHHLRFAQPQALGRKVSDEYTVPLCSMHHDDLHRFGAELAWWENRNIEPLAVAQQLWGLTQGVRKELEVINDGSMTPKGGDEKVDYCPQQGRAIPDEPEKALSVSN